MHIVAAVLEMVSKRLSGHFTLYGVQLRLFFLYNFYNRYRSRGPGFDSGRYQIFGEVVSLERSPLSLMRIIEELLERTVAAPV
jgi:hypothetical protein